MKAPVDHPQARAYWTKFEIMLRWHYDPESAEDKRRIRRMLWKLKTGRHPSGLTLTPISAFRPRRWRGAVLPHDAKVTIEVLEDAKRPVLAVADSTEVRQVSRVEVAFHEQISISLLYDPGHGLNERILKEQFITDG